MQSFHFHFGQYLNMFPNVSQVSKAFGQLTEGEGNSEDSSVDCWLKTFSLLTEAFERTMNDYFARAQYSVSTVALTG